MSNIKQFRICADVPFNYLAEIDGEGLSPADAAGLASLLLSPSTDVEYTYSQPWLVPNSKGGRTSMYRLLIEGEEALSALFLRRIATALGKSGEFAELHIAEYRDIEDPSAGGWEHIVPGAELSGKAVVTL